MTVNHSAATLVVSRGNMRARCVVGRTGKPMADTSAWMDDWWAVVTVQSSVPIQADESAEYSDV